MQREAKHRVLAIIAIVIGGGMSLVIDRDPSTRGLQPDGITGEPTANSVALEGQSVAQAVRTKDFLKLYGACLICGFGVFVPFVHLVPYARDHGISLTSAALLLGALGIGSTAGRFALGGFADRVGRRSAPVTNRGSLHQCCLRHTHRTKRRWLCLRFDEKLRVS